MSKLYAAAACLAFSGLAVTPAVAADPAKLAITQQSERAALILKTDLLPVAPGMRTSYRMTLQSYDPAAEKLRGAPYGGLAVFAARPKEFVDGHLILDVKPGTYVFKDFSIQDRWSLCFNGGSRMVTVKPGEILYLGALDARSHMAELQQKTVMSGQTVIRGHGFVSFFDSVTPPLVTPPDEASLAAAAAFAKAHMPKSSAPVKAANYRDARFGTGNDIFGTQRICGGYYSKSAKPKATE
jgi:hypothetical protein